jgi:hypothetical protein
MRSAILALVGMVALAQPLVAAPVGGARCTSDAVRAHSTDVYTVVSYAGEATHLAIRGDGDTDLDVFVYDANGNLITSDTGYTDTALVSWTPRWTGRFTIRVVNRGSVLNRYTMCVG